MSKTTIPTGGIADDAISEEHLDATALTGNTALAATPATTDEILISDAGTLKRLDFNHIFNTPAFFVYADSSQTVSSSTNTKVTLDNESFDTDNAFASNKFTVPTGEAGKYFFHGQIDCHANNVSENSISNAHIYKNGNSIIESVVDFRNNHGRRVSVHVSATLDLSADDYIELYGNILDTSGDPTFYSTSGGFFTYLTGYKLIGV
tara:strand:+ start:1125 stop:1742 length:618 start_codon:yes stop_codon:yes gene_type:complete